jgi:hypothetical protein
MAKRPDRAWLEMIVGVLFSLSMSDRVQANEFSSRLSEREPPVFSVSGVVQELSGAALDRSRGVVWSLGDSGTAPILGCTPILGFFDATNVISPDTIFLGYSEWAFGDKWRP